jgi:origin recognition complex subunit 1
MSAETYLAKYPTGKVPRSSRNVGKTFICRRGCNTRTATYTSEFVWEEIYHGSEGDIVDLIDRVKRETKATRKNRSDRHPVEDTDEFVVQDDEDMKLHTPKKKRKISATSTPHRQESATKLLTPSYKRHGNLCSENDNR